MGQAVTFSHAEISSLKYQSKLCFLYTNMLLSSMKVDLQVIRLFIVAISYIRMCMSGQSITSDTVSDNT